MEPGYAPVVEAYTLLKVAHVVSAAYLVGSFVTEWALRVFAHRSGDRATRAFVWDFHVKGEERVAIPFAILLVVSGLLMVFGPASGGWSFTSDLWIPVGLGLFVAVLVTMAVLAAGAAKKAHAAYTTGGGERDAAPHERTYRILASVGLALTLAAVYVMVAKPF